MDKREAIGIVKQYGALLKQYMVYDKLYLFGSYASNTPRADSDLDVAIIVKKMDGDYFEMQPLLWKLRREIDDRIEPILLESDNDPAGFINEVKKNGVEVIL